MTDVGSLAEFFHMGGYALYVWPSFGLTAAVLAGLLAVSLRGLKAHEAALQALTEGGEKEAPGEA